MVALISEKPDACAADRNGIAVDGKLPRARCRKCGVAIFEPNGNGSKTITASIRVAGKLEDVAVDGNGGGAVFRDDRQIQHLRPAPGVQPAKPKTAATKPSTAKPQTRSLHDSQRSSEAR